LDTLDYVDRLREALQGTAAAGHHNRRLLPALIGEEVPGLDLRQPARQLIQILLALLHFGEGVLFRPGLLADLVKQSRAALGELVILPGAVGPEPLRDCFINLRRRARDIENECRAALQGDSLRQLIKKLRMPRRIRQQPGAIHRRGRPCGPQAAPEPDSRTRRRAGKLGQ
jgi:hypothetical protein